VIEHLRNIAPEGDKIRLTSGLVQSEICCIKRPILNQHKVLRQLFNDGILTDKPGHIDIGTGFEDDVVAFPLLIEFLSTGEVALNDTQMITSLLRLASRCHVNKCVEICHRYLLKKFGPANNLSLLKDLFQYASYTIALDTKNIILLKSLISKAIGGCDTATLTELLKLALGLNLKEELGDIRPDVDADGDWVYNSEMLQFVFRRPSLIGAQKTAKEVLFRAVADDPADLSILKLCQGSKKLRRTIEREYGRYISFPNFFMFWDYAQKNQRQILQQACRDFVLGRVTPDVNSLEALEFSQNIEAICQEVVAAYAKHVNDKIFYALWHYAADHSNARLTEACLSFLQKKAPVALSKFLQERWSPKKLPDAIKAVLKASHLTAE